MRVRAKQTSSDCGDNYRGTHRLHPVWSFDIIAVSDDRRAIFSETSCLVDQVNCCNGQRRRMSPAIISDDENGSISIASESAAFSDIRE